VQTCQGKFRVCYVDGVVDGSKSPAYDAKDRCQHNVLDNLALRVDTLARADDFAQRRLNFMNHTQWRSEVICSVANPAMTSGVFVAFGEKACSH
jgi:hypothetical protein